MVRRLSPFVAVLLDDTLHGPFVVMLLDDALHDLFVAVLLDGVINVCQAPLPPPMGGAAPRGETPEAWSPCLRSGLS